MDMAETRKVWEFAEAFKQQHPSLNELVGVACLLESSMQLSMDDAVSSPATDKQRRVYGAQERAEC